MQGLGFMSLLELSLHDSIVLGPSFRTPEHIYTLETQNGMKFQGDDVVENFVIFLQKCRKKRDLHDARRLHKYMRDHQLETHVVLGNYLVPMLVDCGSLPDAHQVFDSLIDRNEHSWTSIISGYADAGQPQRAIQLYCTMLDEGFVQPNSYTYLVLLQACARIKDAERGREIHGDIIHRGLERDIFMDSAVMGNTLVDMYGKCGLLVEARHVFDELPVQNAVSWAALIAGYADHGVGEEAGDCFRQMQLEGISPDSVTLVCSLKACGNIGALEMGHEIHLDATKRGLETKLYVGSTLVDMYVKCGLLGDAQQVFDGLSVRDAVPWAALIAGYVEFGLDEEVMKNFKQMEQEGISPDSVTFICSLKSCGTMKALETGQCIHAQVTKRGLERELYIGSLLVDLYSKCRSFAEAYRVFISLVNRDVVSWNALIGGYAELGLHEEASSCLQRMQLDGLSPDFVTFIGSLNACSTNRALETGWKIHAELVKRGMEKELYVGNTLVDMYTDCGSLEEGRKVFDRQPLRDAVSWAALMAGYAEHEFDEEILNCYKQMQLETVSPDSATFVFSLQACCTVGALETGRQIHTDVTKKGLERELYVGSAVVEMYTTCGSVAEGCRVFERMHARSTVSWNALITAYGKSHEGSMAVKCFEDMREQGVKPDAITFTSLLAACSHANLVMKGQEYFELMIKEYEIEPSLDHYACMVDLFARSGHVYKAEIFIAAMQCPPSSVSITALLAACKIYGEVGLGQRCFQQLLEMNLEPGAAYLVMQDIYTTVGRWRDANKVGVIGHFGGQNRAKTEVK